MKKLIRYYVAEVLMSWAFSILPDGEKKIIFAHLIQTYFEYED